MLSIYFLLIAIATMAVGGIALFLLKNDGATVRVRCWSEISSWVAFFFGVLFGFQSFNASGSPASSPAVFSVGPLQAILVPYILFMGILVKRFAYHYIQSDKAYARFFLKIKLLICMLLTFVTANHGILLMATWIASGWIMRAMIQHTQRMEAVNSATLAAKRFIIGDVFLVVGILGLVFSTGQLYLSEWLKVPVTVLGSVWLFCLVAGAFSKTAVIPFQKWMAHTLTAPTPVSAIMHAGFVNSGAILLSKLAPLLVQAEALMGVIFVLGLVSALYGSLAMLVQIDVKRYLTFSTVGQMGFMMMACGLGAFHLAILHLMVHGFFKARLFLSAGNIIEHRPAIRAISQKNTSRLKIALVALACMAVTLWIISQNHRVILHLLELPAILIAFIGLGLLFSATTLVKAKGAGIKGAVVAVIFNLVLLFSYSIYEGVGQLLFPTLNHLQVAGHSNFYTITALMIFGASLIGWLIFLKAISLPEKLKHSVYVAFLNASGKGSSGSTFSHRVWRSQA
ncbi:MAG: proton-conducting transporter membrane subunit [Cyanobacteria bacterium P01_H01_bin.74]